MSAKWLDTDSWFYRKRYIIGYVVVAMAFVWLLFMAGTLVPGGISEPEKNAVIRSANLDLQNIDTLTVASLPYYGAQRGILEVLGVSTFSIKLLSLILAFFAGIGAVFLLRRWFKPNIALLATVIMITTGQFLYIAQSGNPSIMYVLWSVWLLLTATLITTSPNYTRFWKILFFILVPLSLYTPLSIYLVLAIVSAGLIHPHVRHVIRRMSKPHLAMLTTMSLILVAPLIYLISRDPSLGLQLLGFPTTWPPDLLANANTLLQQYVNFITPQSGALMTPVLGLGSIMLIALGIWRLAKIRYTARSYTLVAWIILTLPILLINPSYTTVVFVPLLILMASGLEFLLRSWYRMFPRNPYARFVGLIPLVILVGGLVLSGLNRYFYGYSHDPVTASNFSSDLTLLESSVATNERTMLVVAKDEVPFYNAVATISDNSTKKLIVTTAVPAALSEERIGLPLVAIDRAEKSFDRLAATRAAHSKVDLPIERIVTTSTSSEADRFYIYKTK